MADINSTITYFDKPGKINTEKTIALAKNRSEALGIETFLVSSTTGYTARLAVDAFSEKNVVIVTHAAGYVEPDNQEFDEDIRSYVELKGAKVLTAQHTFAGVNRSIRKSLGGYQIDEIIAHTLRIFGQGMKVVCEIAMMAADAGYVSTRHPTIAIAGTHRGADLGVILIPANSANFFDLKILAIFCMPSLKHPGLKKK